MTAFVFPGQGSQKRGMGLELFDEVREFRDVEQQVNELLGYSLRDLCLQDPQNRLKDTRFTQPCLYSVNALYGYREIGRGVRPSYLAGHSLGEYNALHAAGVFDFMTGLRLVQKRGELMAAVRGGAMAAVIGLSSERVEQVLEDRRFSSIDVANYNSPTQIVISGPNADILAAASSFEAAGATMYVPLPVSAAFHSRYMRETANNFKDFLAPFKFNAPKIPVIANVTGLPYPYADSGDSIKTLLVAQIFGSVQWTDSIALLLRSGVEQFKELGPGNVLTRLIDQIRQKQAAPAAARRPNLAMST